MTKKFYAIDLNNISPKGWLLEQLKIQANSMSGHLDEFWPDIKESSWFGGKSEGWERAPYWLDGIIPLAFLLKDQKLINKVTNYINYIIEHQNEDGWLGPKNSNVSNPEAKDQYDIWAQFLILKVLCQYHDITKDNRLINVVEKCLNKIEKSINWTPLFDWGQARWFEAFIAIEWLYNKTNNSKLLDLATKLQSQGFNWHVFYQNFCMKDATKKDDWNFMGHIVNNSMAIKAYGLVDSLKNESKNKSIVDHMIETLDIYHGTSIGTISGDECLAGKEPYRGTELCSIVEYMFSLEKLIEIYADPSYADRLESIAFNALPAAFTKDMWAHQYDQQINQVKCVIDKHMPWCTNNADANIFGLEPHFGCCTSNYHQGFPKFAAHQWMQNDEGILVATYAPSSVITKINDITTNIELQTEYPFKEELTFFISCEKRNKFSFFIRIPSWCEDAKLLINEELITITKKGYININREWDTFNTVKLYLPMKVKIEHRLNNAIAIKRGPLLFALPIDYEQKQIVSTDPLKEYPHCDYEFYPKSKWNYAISIDSSFEACSAPISNIPFDSSHYAISLKCKGKILPSWSMNLCYADSIPISPVISSELEEDIVLVPFASTILRIAEFPYY